VGTVNIGQRFVLQMAPTCLFTPGQAVSVTVNGVTIPGKVANAGGVVLVGITVVSASQLSVDDPTITPAVCGTNNVTAVGPSAAAQGGTAAQAATFTLLCPTTPIVTTSAIPILGQLSRTGADTLRLVAIAFALLLSGAAVVVSARRRRGAASR
jgi:hypothetical protein